MAYEDEHDADDGGNTLKKGQTWSLDLVIGTVLFLFMLATFYTLAIVDTGGEVLEQEAEVVVAQLDEETAQTNPNVPVVLNNQELNQTGVEELFKRDYKELKDDLGISSEFCILVTINTPGGEEAIIGFGDGSDENYSIGTGEDIYIDNETTYLCGE